MGWDYCHKDSSVSAKEEISKRLTWENDIRKTAVLAVAMKGGVAYAAIESIGKKAGKLQPKTREVSAVVVMTEYARNDHYNFGTKFMCEDCGPYACECPANVLDLLTPTKNENALDWRRVCREKLARAMKQPKLEPGDKVVFPKPFSFNGHGKESSFVCVDPKKLHFQAGFGLCRLRRDTMKNNPYKVYRGKQLIADIAA